MACPRLSAQECLFSFIALLAFVFVASGMLFNPRGETAYIVKRYLTNNTELEIAAGFAMSLGEIHVHYFYHCSQTKSQLLWEENGTYHRSEFREDGQPSAKTGPLVPFGTTLNVVLLCCVDEGDC